MLSFYPFFKKGDCKMFILTDGKNYVMENPMQQGGYLSTTSPIQAKFLEKSSMNYLKCLVYGQEVILSQQQVMYAVKQLKSM